MFDFIVKNNISILGFFQILILFYFVLNSIFRFQYIKVFVFKDCVKKVFIKVKEYYWNFIVSCVNKINCGFSIFVKDFMLIILIIKKKRQEGGV